MATERLSMRQTREILRQKWSLGRTHRAVAQSLRISSGAVGATVLRARAAGLDWAQVDALSEEALQARVYGPPTPPTHHRAVPDGAYLHAERRKPGVTRRVARPVGSLRAATRRASVAAHRHRPAAHGWSGAGAALVPARGGARRDSPVLAHRRPGLPSARHGVLDSVGAR